MDDGRFDELTALLATNSRRGVLRLLVGALLGGPLALLGVGEADAGCAKAGKKCGKDTKCCAGTACKGGRCRCKKGVACRGRCCKPGQRCAGGRCVATVGACRPEPTAQTCTGQKCGPATNNCGQEVDCGGCAGGLSCQRGSCVCAHGLCNNVCTNLEFDDANCGACGTACGADRRCDGGQCVCKIPCQTQSGPACCGADESCLPVVPTPFSVCCPDGTSVCNGGACTDLENDPNNCGQCGKVCQGTPNAIPFCNAGECALILQP